MKWQLVGENQFPVTLQNGLKCMTLGSQKKNASST